MLIKKNLQSKLGLKVYALVLITWRDRAQPEKRKLVTVQASKVGAQFRA